MLAAEGDLQGKSILIFDDGLRSLQGHWYDYDMAVVDGFRRRGAKVTVLCNQSFDQVDAMEAAGATVVPAIRRSAWTGDAPPRRGIAELASWMRQAAHFVAVLDRELKAERYDLVFVPNAMVYDSLAWLLLWWKNRFRNVGRVALLFRFAVQHHPNYVGSNLDPEAVLPKRIRLWRQIGQRLSHAVASGRLFYLTDSLRLAKEYRSALNLQLAVAPSPRALQLHPTASAGDIAAPKTFALLGFARWARGTDLFEQAIRILLDRGAATGLRFVVQWYSNVIDPNGLVYEPSRAVLASDNVEIIKSPLSTEAYEAMFSGIVCMVLPYRRNFYYSQISGVAIEAASSGIPMIYTADTWLEDFAIEQGAGIAVPDGDAAALAEAISTVAADFESYKAQAVLRSAVAQARNSPEAFMQVLWGGAPSAPKAGNLA